MNGPIRVLCVDDSLDLAEAVALTIDAEDGMESAGVLSNADMLCEEIEARDAHIVLIDLTMPGRDPLDAIAEASRRCPRSRAVVISGYDNRETIDAAMNRGAWGFVSKHSDMDRVLKAIREVARGEIFIDRA